MNLKTQKNIFLLLSALATATIWVLYTFMKPNVKTENIFISNLLSNSNFSSFPSLLRENGDWIVNKHSIQYSAYGIFKGDVLKIESLVFMNLGRNGQIRCVVANAKLKYIALLSVVNDVEILPPVHKITCEWPKQPFDKNEKIFVAIISEGDFDFSKNLTDESNILSFEAIQFQRARLFNADKPKKQAIAHCVHMFYGVDDIQSNDMLKFSNWVEIQRTIGYSQMRIYVLKLNQTAFEYLNKKYEGFVTFVRHQTTFDPICGWLKDKLDANPNSKLYETLYNNCKFAFDRTFNPIEGGPHDRVCMNDCYLNFKYEYELFTNYDIDEVIFPRLNEMDNLKSFESVSCNDSLKLEPKYNMYEYGMKLLDKFGKSNIACLMFKHVAYLPNGPELEEFISQIENALSSI